jgi:alpha-L-fucosidase
MKNVQEFKNAKYGLMIHFGLYSLLGGVYKGKRGPNYAEWIQCHQKISNSEMDKLASIFNPIYFDADHICKFAKECGMKYIVVTTKHHEGFALFKSGVDTFNAHDGTPCKRDLIRELADGCKKFGLKLGFYYSQCIDWRDPNGGGYTIDPRGSAGDSWDNNWDFPDRSAKDFSICFRNKIVPQVREIMSNYGDIFLAWFDMPLDSTKEQSKELYDLVKKLQPNCLVNSRLGNGEFDYVSLGDNEIPDSIPENIADDVDDNAIWGFKKSPYGLYESACTLNRSWGYHALDTNWKSAEEIYHNRIKLEKLGINYLINIGPDWLGRIPYESEKILREVQQMYEQNYPNK